jgi:hypothetical protein
MPVWLRQNCTEHGIFVVVVIMVTFLSLQIFSLQLNLSSSAFNLVYFASYSLRFKTKVTFGHNLRYETKGTFGEISLKLRQTNWNVAINNVNVVADELLSQSTNTLHLFNN